MTTERVKNATDVEVEYFEARGRRRAIAMLTEAEDRRPTDAERRELEELDRKIDRLGQVLERFDALHVAEQSSRTIGRTTEPEPIRDERIF